MRGYLDKSEKKNINEASNKQRNNKFNSASLEGCRTNHNETSEQQKKMKAKEKINCYRGIQSTSAIIMALCTLVIAVITAFYTYYARQQVEQMTEAVKATNKQAALIDRPWIKVSIALMPQNRLSIHDKSIMLGIELTMENIGHSVARKVRQNCGIIFMSRNGNYFMDPIDQQKILLKEVTEKKVNFFEEVQSIMPNDKRIFNVGVTASIKPNDIWSDNSVQPKIVGCIDYQYDSSPDHHHTCFQYSVIQINPTTGKMKAIHLGDIIPAKNLRFKEDMFGGSDAN